MGFTHYVTSHVTFTADQWKQFTDKVRKIFKDTKVPLAGPFGDGSSLPDVNEYHVSFNGVEGDAHETCRVSRSAEGFNFCKTAQKPYDEVVVAVYKALRDVLPETKLSSDGGDSVFGKSAPVKEKAQPKAKPVKAKKVTRKDRLETVYATLQDTDDHVEYDPLKDRIFEAMVILREEIAVIEKKNRHK